MEVYHIPDDELVVDAISVVLLKSKSVESQRELTELVNLELNRNTDVPYKVSEYRVRKLTIDRGLAALEIDYRRSYSGLPETCPVCGRDLESITNSTLEGGTAVIMKKCDHCGYKASARESIPSKYTFNIKARRVSELQDMKLDRLNRAKVHIGMACDIIESLIDGHVLAHDARSTVSKLREIADGKDDPGSIGNMIRSVEKNEGEPAWCRPLASVKNSDRKDI
ncbi:MAG: hypothetical protein J6T68_00290 [Candidatus Methanomethylophilaceae archaeon]|nr:hypothetical protein [Candidatus Methanomethylophilaceae archaeon]